MATSNIEKVLTVLQGIGEKNPDLATKFIHPKKYKEHNPFSADGVDGLKAYIASFPPENHHLKVIRAFQDGSYVFTQEDGELFGQNTFFDVFKLEDGWIVEHWAFSAKSAPPNKSGHTQTDGPVEAKHNQNTEKNKSIMRDYYETVHIAGNYSKIREYFSGDVCIRHEPGVSDGVATFIHDLESITVQRSIDEIKILLGQGDFIFIAAKGSLEDNVCGYIDLYRVEDEKIVEHWGFMEIFPSNAALKNVNGLL